ncbi:MAG: chromophore lyase CpcT/CpeT [Flavobacteriales bacterium]|nr:chromophore lyase CpcT/CpeT [Flavobacteriales bacterium]MBK9701730.1 chromophore lyase CpcT/CpeT [Flavobacteriales bacterium]
MRLLPFSIALVAALAQLSASAQRTRALEQLAMTMAGSYTSAAQAQADTSYFEIELEMVRIWPKRRDGAWFYVEQATASSKGKPYRQRIYRLSEVNDSTFTSEIFSIRGGERHFGAYADAARLALLSPDSLSLLEGCAITLHRRGGTYIGSTHERDCPNQRSGAAYATSEVTLLPDRMISWDRGYNAAGAQVWGAEKGGYVFIKLKP